MRQAQFSVLRVAQINSQLKIFNHRALNTREGVHWSHLLCDLWVVGCFEFQNEWAPRNSPTANPIRIRDGITSHHLLPCCAASKPRTPDTTTDARVTGSRQLENGGTKALPRRTALAIPSFADRVM